MFLFVFRSFSCQYTNTHSRKGWVPACTFRNIKTNSWGHHNHIVEAGKTVYQNCLAFFFQTETTLCMKSLLHIGAYPNSYRKQEPDQFMYLCQIMQFTYILKTKLWQSLNYLICINDQLQDISRILLKPSNRSSRNKFSVFLQNTIITKKNYNHAVQDMN